MSKPKLSSAKQIKTEKGPPVSSDMTAESARLVILAITEYMHTVQQEKINRAEIYRKRDTAIAVINAQKETMLEYLRLRFGERSKLYDQYFALIDKALISNDAEIVGKALEAIMVTYKENPFLGFDDFKKIARDNNSVIEI
jgi:hypothetical protein